MRPMIRKATKFILALDWRRALRIVLAALLVNPAPLGVGVTSARAQSVPSMMNFQGRLTDNLNNPLDGSYDFNFKIYDDPAAGTKLWEESQAGVTVTNGVLAVQLGSVTPLTPAVFYDGLAYLEIKVGADVLTPRERLITSPYAFAAKLLDGRSYDAFVSTDAAAQTILGAKTFSSPLTVAEPTAGAHAATKNYVDAQVVGGGSGWIKDGTVVKLAAPADSVVVQSTLTVQGNAFSMGGSTLVVKDGNVGIGTAGPATTLTVKLPDSSNQGIFIQDSDGDNIMKLMSQGSVTGIRYGSLIMYDSLLNETVRLNAEGLSFINGGYVGIGTTSPQEKLHVSSGSAVVDFGVRTSTLTFAAGLTSDPVPAEGMVYYNANDDKLKLYAGSSWVDIATGAIPSGGSFVSRTGDSMTGQLTVGGSSLTVRSNAASSPLLVSTSPTLGVAGLFVDADNRVGIGTTNPGQSLTVSGGDLLLKHDSAAVGDLQLARGAGAVSGTFLFGDASSWQLDFARKSDGGATKFMSVSEAGGGRVGIGTSTPRHRLTIAGDYQTAGLVGAADQLHFSAGGASPAAGQVVWGDNTGWQLRFGSKAGGNFMERVAFVDTGEVGIGTTSPQEKLHVSSGNAVVDFGIRTSTLTFAAGLTGDPAYAANGMLYYNGGTNKLRLYNGSWNDLATGGASGWTDDGAIVKLADQNDNAVVQSTLTVQGNAFSVGGSTFVVTGGSASVSGNMNLASDSGRLRFGSSGDVALGRDAADTLALARGVNPQEMRVYRTTDGTDSEFLKTGWNPAGIFQFTTGKTGAGSRDALYLSAGGTYPYEGLTVGTDGTFQFTGGPGATAVYIKAGLAGGGVALGLARLDGSMIGSILGDDAGTTEIRSQGLYNAFFGRTADALYRPLVIQEASTDAAAYYSRLKMGFGLSTDYFDIQAYQTSGEGTAATLALNPSGGNVGVGTTAPTHKLDVNGGAVVRSSITLAGISSTPNSVAGQGAIYFDTEDAKFKVSENAGGYQDLVAAAGTYVAKAGDSMTGQLTVRGASVEVSSITTFGAVGIGGVGLSGGTLVVKSTSTDPTNPVVNIQANNATEIMRVQQDGKVGVGTTNPSATLEVATGGTGLLIKNTADVVPFKIQEDHTAVVGYNFLEGYRFGEGSPIFAITRNGAGLFGGYTFGSNSGYAIYSSADMPFLAGSEGEVKFYGSKSGDATIPPASAIKSVMLLGNTSIAGGSANGTFLGSNPPSFSGNFVDFQVGGNRRFAVKSDGSVGIGAANPAQKVHMSSGTLLIDGDAAEAFKVGVSTFIINSEGRVGIGTTGPGEKLEVKGAVVQTASDSSIYQAKSYVEHRNLGTTAGDTTNIGTLHFPNGAGLIELDYTGQGAGYSIAAKYVLPVQYANIEQGFNGVWLLAQPVSFTGVYQIEDVNLDIRISAEDVDLRLRRVSGITDATHTMRVTAVGNTFTFTPDSGTGSGAAAPSTVFGAAVLTQRTGRVGIATTSPKYVLDVNGGVIVRSSVTLGGMSSTPNSVAGQGAIYFDSDDNKFKVSENAGGYADLVPSGASAWTKDGSIVKLADQNDNAVVQSTLTVQGNAFSVGASTFAVADGYATMGLGNLPATPKAGRMYFRNGAGNSGGYVGVLASGSNGLELGTIGGDPIQVGANVTGIEMDGKFIAGRSSGLNLLTNVDGSGTNVLRLIPGTPSATVAMLSSNLGVGTSNPAQKVHMSSGTLLVDGDASTAFKVGVSTFIINSEGRAGVGISNPAYKLDVSGDLNLSAGSVYRIAGVAQSGSSKWTTGTGDNIYRTLGKVGIGTGDPSHGKLHAILGSANGALALQAEAAGVGTDVQWYDNDDTPAAYKWDMSYRGSLSSPGDNLQLYRNAGSPDLVTTWTLGGRVGVGAGENPSAKLHVSSANAVAADTVLQVSSGTAAGQELFVIKGDGMTGIGTDSPEQSLHIRNASGVATGRANVLIQATGENSYLNMRADAWTGNPVATMVKMGNTGNLKINNMGSSSPDHLVIDNQGEVGVGAVPSARLHVSSASAVAADTILMVSSGTAAGQELFVIKGDGNIGVGTPSPDSRFKIYQQGGSYMRLEDPGASASASNGIWDVLVSNGPLPDNGGDLAFTRTGGQTPVMTLQADGDVGIGTTNPADKLHVAAGQLRLDNDTDSTNKGCFRYNGTSNQLEYANDCATFQGFSASSGGGWTDGGPDVYLGTLGDKVGIGTSQPSEKLDVRSAPSGGEAQIKAESNAAGNDSHGAVMAKATSGRAMYMTVSDAGEAGNYFIHPGSGTLATTAGAGLIINTNATENNGLAINTSGNVGVGTTDARARLVVGSFAFTGGDYPGVNAANTVNVNNANATASADQGYQLTLTETGALGADKGGALGFQAVYDGSSNVTTIAGIKGRRENATADNHSGYLAFLTRGTTGAPGERVRIDSAGKIGIGTTAPIRSLHSYSATTSNEIVMEVGDGLPDWRKWNFYVNGGAGGKQNMGLRILNDAGTGGSGGDFVMRWLNNGNVGVGMETPSARLHVSSAGAVAADTILQVSSGTAAGQELLVVKGDGQIGVGGSLGTGVKVNVFAANDGTADAFRIHGSSGAVGKYGVLNVSDSGEYVRLGYFNGTAMKSIYLDGKVGVGTTDPLAQLTINALTNNATHFLVHNYVPSLGNTTAWIRDSDTQTHTILRVTGDHDADAGGPYEVVVNQSGQVGIGTSNPSVSLDVNGKQSNVYSFTDTSGSAANFNGANTASANGTYYTNYFNITARPRAAAGVTWGGYHRAMMIDTTLYDAGGTYTGTINTSEGIHINYGLEAGGAGTTIASLYGLNLNPFNTKTVTDHYGLYVGAVSATNDYSIYTAGAKNYFGGKVGIGVTSPNAPLEVQADSSNDGIRIKSNGGNYCILRMSETTTCGTGTLLGTNANRAVCLVCN